MFPKSPPEGCEKHTWFLEVRSRVQIPAASLIGNVWKFIKFLYMGIIPQRTRQNFSEIIYVRHVAPGGSAEKDPIGGGQDGTNPDKDEGNDA